MSITKVARQAGVSQATVSNVINNRPNVDAQTAARVRATMAELGYKPRPVGQRPGRRPRSADGIRSGVIALVWPGADRQPGAQSSIACGLIEGITGELRRRGLDLKPIFADEAEPDAFRDDLAAVDGCLVHGTLPESLHDALRNKPLVWLGSVGPREWGDRVVCDNAQIGQDAVQVLFDAGAEELIYANLVPEHPAYRERGFAFQQASSRRGMQCRELDFPVDQTDADLNQRARAAAERLVQRFAEATTPELAKSGLFVGCDRHAALIEREVRRLGSDAMQHVPMVACDHDDAALAGLTVRPTTFEIQPMLIGQLAVERLAARMKSPSQSAGQITVQVPSIRVDPDGTRHPSGT
ncbi:MAG: LacI family DNA-binding transcriptional regulator [Planctomycetota bacterium]